MGKVVQLRDYRQSADSSFTSSGEDSLVPVQLAVGCQDRHVCLEKIGEYGIRAVHIHVLNDQPDALVYLVRVQDAIWLNKKILEHEEISDEEIADRIDLIQMLENADQPLMEHLWKAFTHTASISCD